MLALIVVGFAAPLIATIVALRPQQFGALVGLALHNDDAADVLAGLVGLVDETIDESAQESPGAELQDGFRERHVYHGEAQG